jgi:hypothetical protein
MEAKISKLAKKILEDRDAARDLFACLNTGKSFTFQGVTYTVSSWSRRESEKDHDHS